MLYAPKLSTCSEAQEIKETGMKKISTTTAQAFRKIQKLTIGLDLGDRSSWYCVPDERGAAVLEQSLSTTPKAMQEVFGGMPRSRKRSDEGRRRAPKDQQHHPLYDSSPKSRVECNYAPNFAGEDR
jgi:hypothetical protein